MQTGEDGENNGTNSDAAQKDEDEIQKSIIDEAFQISIDRSGADEDGRPDQTDPVSTTSLKTGSFVYFVCVIDKCVGNMFLSMDII